MTDKDSTFETRLSHRLREGIKSQEIAGNPLNAEQIEMFEMFEREEWSHERRREYILARALDRAKERAMR